MGLFIKRNKYQFFIYWRLKTPLQVTKYEYVINKKGEKMIFSGRDDEFRMFSDSELIRIYKKSFLDYGFEDENLVGVYYFIHLMDTDEHYKLYKYVTMLLLAEYGTSDLGFKKYFLKNGFILKNLDEPESVEIKMENNKILGYYEDVGWEEMSERILNGKWKVKNYKEFEKFYFKENNIY